MESCRCAHCEPAAREKARAAQRWGEPDPIESWYAADGRLTTLTYLVEDDTSNEHKSAAGQALPHAIPLEAPPPDAASGCLLLTVGEHSVRTSGGSSAHVAAAALTFAVELAMSELVTNVVRHVPDGRCTVPLVRQTAGVQAEVTDGVTRLTLVTERTRPESESGWSLTLVDAVVDKWGISRGYDGGKTVWFECGAEPRV
ncbi:ATP-binding protein [Streptomyces sioyaensis]|uniref:ATP-binding protein n=1 Tax=Streptomyces sioyaensis TaxID=67364 RepID=UPI0036E0FFA5